MDENFQTMTEALSDALRRETLRYPHPFDEETDA